MEIIDSHIHYWQPSLPDRPWDPKATQIGTPESVEEVLSAAKAAGVTKIVQVTPSIMGYDNRYAFEGAEQHPQEVLGVFVRFDPLAPDMAQRLAKERSRPKFLGVRLTLLSPPYNAWLQDGALEPFLAEAGKQGVPVAIYASYLEKQVADAARRHPQTRILSDHASLRHSDKEPFVRWSDTLAMAAVPNIWVKASYFPEVAHEPYPFKSLQPRLKELYDTFGPDRIIWGSDYPLSRKHASYKESVDFVATACDFLSEDDKRKIFGATLLRAVAKA